MVQAVRGKQTDIDVVLTAGTRPFTGKQAGVSTTGGDPATTLVTKDYVDAIVAPGLDKTDKNQVSAVTSGDGSTTGLTITSTPLSDSWVGVFINGVGPYELGDGVKTKACYFSSDGGTTAKTIATIAAGDILYWNGATVGFELDASDEISFVYVS